MGDGTNLVTVFAGELLTKADDLMRMGLPLADIIEGFELAYKKVDELSERTIAQLVSTCRADCRYRV